MGNCLIAAVTIENRASLLHADRDFDRIAESVPLQVASLS
jgi:predicted nucleic acid-binding protein